MADEYDDFSVGYTGPSTGAIRILDHLLALAQKPEDANG